MRCSRERAAAFLKSARCRNTHNPRPRAQANDNQPSLAVFTFGRSTIPRSERTDHVCRVCIHRRASDTITSLARWFALTFLRRLFTWRWLCLPARCNTPVRNSNRLLLLLTSASPPLEPSDLISSSECDACLLGTLIASVHLAGKAVERAPASRGNNNTRQLERRG